jgi:RNA-directed DNA polymerase
LLHTAKAGKTTGSTAPEEGTCSLLDEVMQPSNLAEALLHVARNRGAAGVDGKSVDEVVVGSHWLLPKLRRALQSGQYCPGDVRRVWIPKPGGGQRGLGIPNVVDRWVQQTLHQVLAQVFEPTFHSSSHGFRPHRGAHTALVEAKEYLAEGRTWVVCLDLSKFFDRVNHQRLLARLSHRVSDGRLLRLVHQMLKAKVVLPDGTRVVTEQGTPQGGPLSPLLSNVVLDELDWELARRGLCFVRYGDDFNVYVRSERAGRRVMASLTGFIEKRLRLKVNAKKSHVAPPEEVHFLGFSLHVKSDGQVEVHLSKRSRDRLDRRIRELTPRNWGASIEDCIERASRYLRGWVGYFRLCTEEGAKLFARYDAHIRRRMRAIIVVQRGRPRHLYRHLVSRGASRQSAARTAFRSCGIWKKSNLPGMTRAYRNAWFHARLVSLSTSWWNARSPMTATAFGQAYLPGFEMQT